MNITVMVVDPATKLAVECLSRYYGELAERFEHGFDPIASTSVSPDELRLPRGCFLVAMMHDQAVGCGAVRFYDDFAEIKRMWVSPSARGRGIAKTILAHLENTARRAGFGTIRLDTNATLEEAISLYEKSGYCEISPYNDNIYADHWYEKRL
jgi:ribosomal protein S18 acetylase RimI-like enzyme